MEAVLGAIASLIGTLVVLTAWGSVRAARRLPSFRCRVGPPTSRARRARARWCLRRTRATWVGDVLLIRSGALRLWLVPLVAGVDTDVGVRELGPREVRGLGSRPVALGFRMRDVGSGRTGEMEIAVAAEDADRLVGPFLTAGLPSRSDVRRERGR